MRFMLEKRHVLFELGIPRAFCQDPPSQYDALHTRYDGSERRRSDGPRSELEVLIDLGLTGRAARISVDWAERGRRRDEMRMAFRRGRDGNGDTCARY